MVPQVVTNFQKPLNALKRKDTRFKWSTECQTVFEILKKRLVTTPVLGHPNFSLPFVVYTDASEVGLGAVLVQQTGTGTGTEEVLCFASRSLNKAERNYSATELECLAVVWAVEKWRYNLEGRFFTVVTDHSSLVWVFKTQKPNTRLIRWAPRLHEFSFAVEYCKGKYNTVPDALSRAPGEPTDLHQPICATLLATQKSNPVKDLPISDDVIWKAQQDDPYVQELYQSILEKGEVAVNASTKFTILEGMVYRVVKMTHKTIYKLYIPEPCRHQLLQRFHEDPLAGHLGRYKTYKRMQSLLYWPRLSLDVKNYVRNCHVCQAYKPKSRKVAGKLQQTIVHHPWEMAGVDLMGPIPRSSKRNVYLLIFVDYYSRWTELFPLRKATAETVLKILIQDILTRWGVPNYIVLDQGPQFVANVFEETCREWNLKHKMTTAYHPQTNLTERINRTLKTMI